MSDRVSAERASVACSGATYSGVPMNESSCVSRGAAFRSLRTRARPKSRTFTSPFGVTIRFCGLMSRWTMPVLEGVLQAQRRLADEVAGAGHRQRPLLLQQLGQAHPLDELHDEEVQVAGLVGVVGAGDVLVVELAGGADLGVEAGQRVGVVQDGGADDLQRDGLLHDAVFGQVDDAHAAATQLAHDAELRVVRQFRRHVRRRGGRCRRPPRHARGGGRSRRRWSRREDGAAGPGSADLTQEGVGRQAGDGLAAVGAGLQVGGDGRGLGLGQFPVAEQGQRLRRRDGC